jgi:hypothetical protein
MRHRPERRGEEAKWVECAGIQWVERWVAIPEVFANSDIEASEPILAVLFLGVVGAKHQCRPATPEELHRPDPESPIKEPTGFMFARQDFVSSWQKCSEFEIPGRILTAPILRTRPRPTPTES